jgi:hypothetical protein
MGLNLKFVDASDRFFSALKGIIDPEEKRRIIGELFTRIFEEEAEKEGIDTLVQGTIAPDWIESGDRLRDTIKSHHNVGALPSDVKLRIVEPARVPEFGKVDLVIDREHELFSGVPKQSVVWSSHNDEVTIVPKNFDTLAHSATCKVQALTHRNRPIFGLQFHPEVEHTEYGVQIFKNFVRICESG